MVDRQLTSGAEPTSDACAETMTKQTASAMSTDEWVEPGEVYRARPHT